MPKGWRFLARPTDCSIGRRMEKMPYQPALGVANGWQQSMPQLAGMTITLRELELSDAPALFAMLTPEEVSRFISPPPPTVEGFERFIAWARAERASGRHACF